MGTEKNLGKRGEEHAVEYINNKGYIICERNFRMPFGEIDIIGRKGHTIVFFEVKTRTTLCFGSPGSSVTRYKRLKLSRVALGYISRLSSDKWDYRFDVIEVFVGNNSSGFPDFKIAHIKNAFPFVE